MIKLIPRELQVLKFVCQDKMNREIAEKMSISLRQIEKIKKSIYEKTKTSSSLGLFKWAVRNGYYTFKIKWVKLIFQPVIPEYKYQMLRLCLRRRWRL